MNYSYLSHLSGPLANDNNDYNEQQHTNTQDKARKQKKTKKRMKEDIKRMTTVPPNPSNAGAKLVPGDVSMIMLYYFLMFFKFL